MRTRLGYCCQSLGDFKSHFRTITLTRARGLGADVEDKLKEIYRHNLEEYIKILDYNMQNGFMLFRVTSDLLPLADMEPFKYLPFGEDMQNSWDNAARSTALFLSRGGRIVSHPSQFVSLGSPAWETRNNSIRNLKLRGKVMDWLKLPMSELAAINIHLSNGTRGLELLDNYKISLDLLPPSVTTRLVFENEDRGCWKVQEIREHFPSYPVTFDFHHWNINNNGEPLEDAFRMALESWGNTRPLMHISEGKTKPLDRTHHDYVETLPYLVLGEDGVDLEIEAKQKDLAVFHLRNKYGDKIL